MAYNNKKSLLGLEASKYSYNDIHLHLPTNADHTRYKSKSLLKELKLGMVLYGRSICFRYGR